MIRVIRRQRIREMIGLTKKWKRKERGSIRVGED